MFINFYKDVAKLAIISEILLIFTILNQHYEHFIPLFQMDILNVLPLFLSNMRGWQLIIILVVILLLFGGRKIPELMRGLGKGVQSFKQGLNEAKEELNKPLEDDEDKKKDSDK